MIRFYGNPWASSRIRGQQIVDRLVADGVEAVFSYGVHDSDERAREGDTLIFIKCSPLKDPVLDKCKVFIDVVDSHGTFKAIKKYKHLKDVRVISIGDVANDYIHSELRGSHSIYKIPEQHCNFENVIRPKERSVNVVGFCGYDYNFHLDEKLLQKMLNALGYDLIMKTDMQDATRESICSFYEQIDIQVCYRRDVGLCVPLLKNPLKVINAASFGVPTVSFLEPSYKECQSIITTATDIYDMVKGIAAFTDKDVYDKAAEKCIEFAKDYHIDKIVKKYREVLQC